MADVLQLRGGSTSDHGSFTGAAREVTVDTDKNVPVVHDGATGGGHPAAAEADLTSHTGATNNPHSVTASQVGAPPDTRTLAAGAGLSGGGDLSGDRTFSVAGWTVQTSAYTASVMERVLADTTGGAWTLTLPGSPAAGDAVEVADGYGSFGTNSLTIDGNGNNINGSSSVTLSTNGARFTFVYDGAEWRQV